jgi:8-hydroxy-5-deazaflavin:NADPH oxidoreductase
VAHRIAVVGGTGPQGRGLAYRFARHGHDVLLGSRSAERAEAAAAELRARLDAVPSAGQVHAAANGDACERANIVLVAVPYDGHDELVATLPLDGKIVVSCVNPLSFDKLGPFGRPLGDGADSAAETTQRIAPGSSVVGAFHHVSAVALWGDVDYLAEEDVLVCGDSPEAKATVQELAATVTGRRGIDAGRLRLARQLEPWTAVLISINKAYKTHSGVRVTGV